MNRAAAVFLLPVLAALLMPPASARAADIEHGELLAKTWCASCHIVGRTPPARAQVGPPSFPALAHSGVSPARLRTFLVKPHGSMPDLSLSRAEIADLVAYIESLR
jgi:mono/diheme cytochrome c family protein